MKKLIWHKVESSNIASYAHEDNDLFVTFKGGSVYKYIGVDEDVVAELTESESKGKYINSKVKNSYLFEKVDVEV